MHNNNKEAYQYKELLKSDVENKYGKQVVYSKDCRLLGSQVHQATGRQLSVSTIKRFFGLIQSPFHPSKYTLDTFSSYLGLEDWASFIETRKQEVSGKPYSDGADLLKKSLESITKTSRKSLERKVHYNSKTVIHRTFADAFFEGYIESGKTAAMLIAPVGYGKSVLLLQWMKCYFSGKDSRFKNDVVCLVDGGIFFSFYNQAQENELLIQLLDFDFKTIRKLYERQKSNPQKERYWLIIDDVDRVFSDREKYYRFAENIMQLILLNKENPWFRVILTCRPENLDTFTALVVSNPVLAEAFYKVNFFHKNHHDVINVPLFSDDELKRAFVKHKSGLPYYILSLYYPDVLEIINTPQFFTFFIHDDISAIGNSKEIDFINRLIQHFYYAHPFAEEKQQLLRRFFYLCHRNENRIYVEKDFLLEEMESRLAYQELIKAGLLYEYIDAPNQPEVQLNVRFANHGVFEYLLAWSLIKEKGLGLSLIDYVFKMYRDIIYMQYALLRWIIKIAFYQENISFLKQVHQLMESQVDVSKVPEKGSFPGALRSIQTTFLECFRMNPTMREMLLPELAKSSLGQKLYFEEFFDMDNLMNVPEKALLSFIQHNETMDGKMIFHFIRFARGFYSLDYKLCSLEFNEISRISYSELKSPLSLGYYFSSWFLFAFLNNYSRREDMLEKFLASVENARVKNLVSFGFHPGFAFYVVYHLNACNFFEECRLVAEALTLPDDSKEDNTSGFIQFFRLCYARALLHTGEQKKAFEIFRQLNFTGFPLQMKHFMQMHVNMARYDFLKGENKKKEALTLLQETQLLANQMGYTYFAKRAKELHYHLLNASND